MKNITFILSLFCFIANPCKAQKDQSLKLTWQLIESNYQKSGKSFSVITLLNNGSKSIPAKGWNIYFNGTAIKNATGDVSNVKITFLNGDFLKLHPGKSFKPILPGKSIQIKVLSRVIKNITDFPKGFYIVFDNAPSKGIAIAAEMKPLATADKTESVLAEKIYQQNKDTAAYSHENSSPFLPTPSSYKKNSGSFTVRSSSKIQYTPDFIHEAEYLAEVLKQVTGKAPVIGLSEKDPAIILQKKAMTGNEDYELQVSPSVITISASGSAGIFYGIQSLKMLFPAKAWALVQPSISIDAVEIIDSPRFGHRAFMMDVSRNFQQKKEVYKLIDLLSLYKINVLHMHLTDDEGWRLEIPGLPELTSVGAKRGHTLSEKEHLMPSYGSGPDTVNAAGSGFYSRADFVEILKYATARHIEVIPEIETPGHARSTIKSMDARYERLLKKGNRIEAEKFLLRDLNDQSDYRSVQGWNDNVINVALPSVYTFLEKVTDELINMYKDAKAPLKTIHIGGDEVPAGVWMKSPAVKKLMNEDPSIKVIDDLWFYYFSKVNNMLKSRSLYLSGWEEIGLRNIVVNGVKKMEPETRFVKENFHVDVWNNLSGNEDLAYKLANAGYKVVLTNVTNMYLDLAYNESFNERGQYWGGYVDVTKPFSFIPFNYYKNQYKDERGKAISSAFFDNKERLTEAGKLNIVGLQAPLWSEVINSEAHFEYLLLPKLFGIIERAWAKEPAWAIEDDALKSQELYKVSLTEFLAKVGKSELPRLDVYGGGFNYRIPTAGVSKVNGFLQANVQYPGFSIKYTTDGTEPSFSSKLYTNPIPAKGIVIFRVFNAAGRGSRSIKFYK